jgi:NADPH:quinone reductase-like Zn-dependent oxidoreductase
MTETLQAPAATGVATDTMKAVVYEEYGSPDVLRLAEVPRPVAGPGEALVRIKACAINGYDLMAREGSYKPNKQFPHILGGDISGVVDSYGPGCQEKLPAGAGVMLYWVRSCFRCEPCLRGFPTTCLNYQYIGAHLQGGYAEYVVVPEENLVALGDYTDWAKAAAFPMAYGTSWHMLITRAQLTAGETVLIQAAGSGIGMAAVQIAKLVGANIIATASSDEKLERAREMGAEHLINYSEQNVREEVMRITGKRGVDLLFEHVGGDMFADLVGSITRNGRMVTCGGTAGYQVSMNIAHIFHKQVSIIGSNSATRWEMEQYSQFLLDGTFDPVVDSVFPLEEAADAHRHLAARKQFGKVVLGVDV